MKEKLRGQHIVYGYSAERPERVRSESEGDHPHANLYRP